MASEGCAHPGPLTLVTTSTYGRKLGLVGDAGVGSLCGWSSMSLTVEGVLGVESGDVVLLCCVWLWVVKCAGTTALFLTNRKSECCCCVNRFNDDTSGLIGLVGVAGGDNDCVVFIFGGDNDCVNWMDCGDNDCVE